MYNYFMLIGRIISDVQINEVAEGKRVLNLCLSVARPFKSQDGTFTTDLFNVSLWDFLADLAFENLKKGSKVAIKGRLAPQQVTLESGSVITVTRLVGERIIFFDNKNTTLENTEEAEN